MAWKSALCIRVSEASLPYLDSWEFEASRGSDPVRTVNSDVARLLDFVMLTHQATSSKLTEILKATDMKRERIER